MNKRWVVSEMKRFWISLVIALGIGCDRSAIAQTKIYTPIPLTPSDEIKDRLSENDIPTGQGNFARDYSIQLQSGDQVSIDLSSDNFDTIVTLMTAKGETVAENDDGPDGTTNSLLFTRITKSGNYVVRVKAFGETPGGPFKLKLTKLKPAN
ncbi:PPC domain-containing protein [Phormidesmis priestleyi]|uniref:PPC domain-containing protein n=1 Tax=Phormidesmis priestleyi TaxID=268141 RepID=UPI002F91272C